MRISCTMSLFRGRPFGNVPGNTSLNSSASSFNYPRTPESTLDRISSSRSSTLRKHFFGYDFFIMSRIFPFVSPNDSVFTATLTFLFSYPHTTARKIGVLFFTSLFNCLTEVNLSLPGQPGRSLSHFSASVSPLFSITSTLQSLIFITFFLFLSSCIFALQFFFTSASYFPFTLVLPIHLILVQIPPELAPLLP